MGVALIAFIIWAVLIWRAYNGEEWEMPVAGGLARKMV
jgi:uncharacterized membrane protein